MKRSNLQFAACFVAGTLASLVASAQTPDASHRMVTKVYRIFDLVSEVPQYPFHGLQMNSLSRDSNPFGSGQPMGNMGGMGGGQAGGAAGGMGGGMGGGGFFQIEETLHQAGGGMGGMGGGMGFGNAAGAVAGPSQIAGFRFSADELIDSITATVAPDSWEDVGGDGALQYLGGMLIISQTKEVHGEIAALLDLIRSNSNATTSVEINAYWVGVKGTEQIKRASDQANDRSVDRTWLKEAVAQSGASGRIVCLDGQTVHLAAGNFRTVVTGFTPIVGSVESNSKSQHAKASQRQPIPASVLAQFGGGGEARSSTESGGFGGGVGYQPQTSSVNMGALLQVTPALVPQSDRVILDVRSIVTRSHPKGSSTTQIANAGSVENINVVAQQFMTTINMPTNQPIVVGGATLTPMSNDDEAGEQLYLVVEASPM